MPDSAITEKRQMGWALPRSRLLLVKTRVQLIHHRRPLGVLQKLLLEEVRLGWRPEWRIHQSYLLGQRMGGKKTLDFFIGGRQAQLFE